MKVLRMGALKIFRHPKGGLWKNCLARRGAPKICILQNQQEGWGRLLKNWTASEGGCQNLEFQYLHPPPVILNELSLISKFKMHWCPNEGRYWAVKLSTAINLVPLLLEEHEPSVALLDLSICWCHMHTPYCSRWPVIKALMKSFLLFLPLLHKWQLSISLRVAIWFCIIKQKPNTNRDQWYGTDQVSWPFTL